MELKLRKLTIENFKGIRHLEITFDGNEPLAEISGGNGTGKSSIHDAYTWLLFDKDAAGDKDFSIKPRQPDGEDAHCQNVRVLGEFDLDGKLLTLEKVYSEVWTKRRGEEAQEYSGNTTEHYIDAAPRKAGEYKAFISSLADEDKFRMVASAKYFNEAMGWQERRALLFELAGQQSEEDIIYEYGMTAEGAGIREALGGRGAEDALKIYQSRAKKANAELDKLPVRIDELSRTVRAEIADETEAKAELEDMQGKIEAIDRQIVEKRNFQKEADAKIREISGLKVKMSEREFDLKNAGMQERMKADRLAAMAEARARDLEADEGAIGRSIQAIADKEAERDGLRAEYAAEAARAFEIGEGAAKCMACGQELPADMKAAGIDRLRGDFEADKAKRLEAIKRRGDRANSEIKAAGDAMEAAKSSAKGRLAELEKLRAEIGGLAKTAPEAADAGADPTIIGLKAEIAKKQAEADNIASETADALIKEKAALSARVAEIGAALGRAAMAKETRERIAELRAEQQEMAETLAGLRRSISAVEGYVRFKCGHVAEAINSLFGTAKFKLFETQINGGISETCECLIGGVPYRDANNAAKLNAGLEIADILGGHFGFRAPIFVDNAESVNAPYQGDAQTIALTVTKSPKLAMDGGEIKDQSMADKPTRRETNKVKEAV